MTSLLNVKIDREPYAWATSESRRFMGKDYLAGEETLEDRVKAIAKGAQKELGIKGLFAKKLERATANGWVSWSTPVWCNSWANRGLPISCFGSYIEDSMKSILLKNAEVGMMSKIGGGTSAYFGNLRARGTAINSGGQSFGPVHFMELFKTTTKIVSQGSTRRGSCAAYLDIDHPDIEEFLRINSTDHVIQDFSFAVNVSNAWLEEMEAGDKKKRAIWTKVHKKRFETGYPYILFIDNANDAAPQMYKDKGKKIVASNLCSEIMLSSSVDESFVCDLSSVNLRYFEEWKDTDFIEVMIYLLDAVMSEFIRKAKDVPLMEDAVRFAENQRALGLGVIGYHSFLQSKMIPFESMEAKYWNNLIFKSIDEQSLEASKNLAVLFGEPKDLKGYGVRNALRCAIAPTTASSKIMGESPGIEPWTANYMVEKLAKGNFTVKNVDLVTLLEAKGKNTQAVMRDILLKGGSVQHLDFLDDHEKAVFRTFGEISQMEIIIQAGQRQAHIDQGQSLNVKIHPDTPLKDVNKLVMEAWKRGVKSLYYQRGTNPAQELRRNLLTCVSCDG
jgi:ribonucleoside-diphosphate reductase alpha chain